MDGFFALFFLLLAYLAACLSVRCFELRLAAVVVVVVVVASAVQHRYGMVLIEEEKEEEDFYDFVRRTVFVVCLGFIVVSRLLVIVHFLVFSFSLSFFIFSFEGVRSAGFLVVVFFPRRE